MKSTDRSCFTSSSSAPVSCSSPALALLAAFAFCLAGCSNTAPITHVAPATVDFTSTVTGGEQPVTGAAIQPYAAGTTGDALTATPLVNSTVTAYSGGYFRLTGTYTCPTATSPEQPGQVYLVSTGGNPGLPGTVHNPQLTLMAALGPCSQLAPTTYIILNEQTTVATVAALAPFIASYTNIGSAYADVDAFSAVLTQSPSSSITRPATLPARRSLQIKPRRRPPSPRSPTSSASASTRPGQPITTVQHAVRCCTMSRQQLKPPVSC